MNIEEKIRKLWPDYFKNFYMPPTAREDRIAVFRACKSCRCDHESFMNTYEEDGFSCDPDQLNNPSTYSMSVYYDFKDVKRFKSINRPPCEIASGFTNPERGQVSVTREWNPSKYYRRSSHVDYWLYQDSKPERDFEIIDFDEYLQHWLAERKNKNGEKRNSN